MMSTFADKEALRDQFAMAALTGLLSHDDTLSYQGASDDAYGYAAAMMRARMPDLSRLNDEALAAAAVLKER